MLTIAYFTGRKDPKIGWFFDSLTGQVSRDTQIVIVDRHWNPDRQRQFFSRSGGYFKNLITHVPPKPTVWQGESRLPSSDYFAAANARNTAICLCRTQWLAFIDDLSVLLPNWGQSVQTAINANRVTLGAYRKVNKLVVHEGRVESFDDHPIGIDVRYHTGRDDMAVQCPSSYFFGCSLVAPVEAFLKINGFCEYADGMGYEDCITGSALERQGYQMFYDRSMMTLESEEDHFIDEPLKRWDKGVSPNDKSHALLSRFGKMARFENYFGPEGIAGLRQRVLAGEPFPPIGIPEHDWYDGQPLREM